MELLGLGKSSQQKQTTQNYFILAVKLDIVLIYSCIFVFVAKN